MPEPENVAPGGSTGRTGDFMAPLRRAERYLAARLLVMERRLPTSGEDCEWWDDYRRMVDTYRGIRAVLYPNRPPAPEDPGGRFSRATKAGGWWPSAGSGHGAVSRSTSLYAPDMSRSASSSSSSTHGSDARSRSTTFAASSNTSDSSRESRV